MTPPTDDSRHNPLAGFDTQAYQKPAPSPQEVEVERFCRNTLPFLPQDLLRRVDAALKPLLPPVPAGQNEKYDSNYSISLEIESLIRAVRAQQSVVMYDDGRPKPDIEPKDVKDVVTSTTSLLHLLIKTHEKVMNMERMRVMEQVTIEVLRELGGDETVERFCNAVEARLEDNA